MPKPDAAHLQTDKELAKLEKRIAKIYKEAADDLQKTIDDYFAKFAKRDAKQKARLEAGEITEQEYKQWRLAQMGRGERFKALQSRVAERYTEANETAVRYVNDATPGIYSLNRNYSAYTIEKVAGNIGFDLWDEQTVKRLIVDNPELMPYYPPEKALNRGIDLAYGKRQISASVTSSILQGKSIPRIAKDLQTRMPEMNKASAVRTARTAVTGAQNAGRMDSYVAAEKMGIKVRKEWLATLDGRTRHSHAMLDGKVVDKDKKFENGCMFPGDPNGAPEETYNCRCTLIAAVDGIDTSNAKRRVRNPETGKNELVSDMTYSEWAGWKEKAQVQKATEKAENQERIRRRREEYFARKRQESEPDFENMTKAQLDKYVSENISAKFSDVSGVNTDFYRKTVKAVKRVETKYGKIDGLNIEFGGIKGSAYAEYDPRTKTLHLKKRGSLSQFADSIARADEKTMRKYGIKYNAESSYEGTVFHELAHAIDHDGGWALSRSLGATDDILIKSRSISFYARDRGMPNLPRATEATAENISSYFMGNTDKIDKDVLSIIEEYFKRKKK